FHRLGLKRPQLAFARALAGAVLAEHAVRIAHAVVVAGRARALLRKIGSRSRMRIRAHSPCRAMPGQRFLLETGDLRIGDAGKIIEALVVLAHMVEAEFEIFALAHAPDRRAVGAGFVAAVPLADRRARL